ncbi:MAG: ATP-grasp domain-containing protein [Acidimicrobiia bacterium]|nr:ATP-grasp domain-containing protein [Acidimicrobiia bacterium]
MPRVLVIVPNDSYRAADFVAAASGLGVDLAIASEERPPLRPDDRFVEIDCAEPEASAEAIADLAARTPIDAVVAADDTGVEIAARASRLLGLRSNDPVAAAATLDKSTMRSLLAAGEVPQPRFLTLELEDDPAAVVASFEGPVVIKPTMLSAGRGVLRVDSPSEAAPAAERIRGIVRTHGRDPSRPLLVERYVDGPEISVEAILWEGEIEVLAIFDKPVPMTGPTFEETIFVTPSRQPPEIVVEVERVVAAAVRALGLGEGPIHAELRIENGRPQMIEVAGRTIGGLCGRALRFGLLGAPLEALVLRNALGMRKQSLRRERSASGVLMVPVPRAGRVRSIKGLEAVDELGGITGVEVTAPVGTRVAPPPDGDRYVGFVFARAEDPAAVEAVLRQAMETIVVEVE